MSAPINGISTQPTAYGMAEQDGVAHPAATAADYTSSSAAMATNGSAGSEIPKDEVGWYFVEQYYTTLSKNPDKLYLFYSKKSQYVSGNEAENSPVSVGQKAINERIKSQTFPACKVRVNNVDSQGSGSNIVVQVIGEMSINNQPNTRRFSQTFVLAEQPNGYFVLNDILRYLLDGDEEEENPADSAPSAQVEVAGGHQESSTSAAQPKGLGDPQNDADREEQAAVVDQGIEDAIEQSSKTLHPQVAVTNGVAPAEISSIGQSKEASATASSVEDKAQISTAEAVEKAKVEDLSSEKPRDPEPTPAASSPKPAPAQTAEQAPAPKPSAPKSWASMVAGSKVALPAAGVAQPQGTSSSSSSQPKQMAPSTVQTQTTSTSLTAQDTEQPATPQSSGSEWQTARNDHGKKQNRPQQVPQAATDENSRAYIKHVGENIDPDVLRNALSKYGEVVYLDINRPKSCAFADFKTPAGYQAAVAANPHDIGGTRLIVEERRVRPTSMGGFAPRGGPMNRGRGNFDGRASAQGRGGAFQRDGGRGGYPNRGRGNGNGRGRGVSQAA